MIDSLDDLVRVALDQQVVLERRGLAFVPVDDEVGGGRLSQHRPLPAGREAGPTTTKEARRVDLGSHLFRRHLKRLLQPLVATRGQIALDRVRVLEAEPRGDDPGRIGYRHEPPDPSCALPCASRFPPSETVVESGEA